MPSELFTLNMVKSILHYWLGDYATAITYAAQARQYKQTVAGLSLIPQYNFYESLSLLANAAVNPQEQQAELLAQVETNQAQLKAW